MRGEEVPEFGSNPAESPFDGVLKYGFLCIKCACPGFVGLIMIGPFVNVVLLDKYSPFIIHPP